MARNIYRFRRLKWGRPKKFKMMPEDTTPPGAEAEPENEPIQLGPTRRWNEGVIAVAVIAVLVILGLLTI